MTDPPDTPGLRRTPLFAEHEALGARIVDYAGFALPVQYAGIVEEHRAVRTGAGLFDVSHMGEVLVSGSGAPDFLRHLLVNDPMKADGVRAVYSPLCREDGGTVDDLLVYRASSSPGVWLLVVNAANTARDLDWIRNRAGRAAAPVLVEDASDRFAQLALQGPAAARILGSVPGLAGLPALLRTYRHADAALPSSVTGSAPCPVLVSRTGYTGEDGFELYLSPEAAPALWRLLLSLGAVPAGLGARDSLRFEAALPLYGHELDDGITPVEAGLARFIDFSRPSFPGRAVLARQVAEGPPRRLVGLASIGRAIPRAGYPVLSGDRPVGFVTSGMYSPTLGRGLAMALVEAGAPTGADDLWRILVRDRPEPFAPCPLPFYRRSVSP